MFNCHFFDTANFKELVTTVLIIYTSFHKDTRSQRPKIKKRNHKAMQENKLKVKEGINVDFSHNVLMKSTQIVTELEHPPFLKWNNMVRF